MLSSLEISHHIAGYLSLNDIGALDALESLYEFNARGHDVSQGMFQRGDDGQSDIENQQHPSGMRSRLGATASFCAADSDINPKAGLQTSITKKNEKNWKRTKQSQNTHA